QDVLGLLPTEPALLQHQLVDTTAGIERLARDCACTLVADVGNERGDDADAALDDTANMLAVGGDAADAPLAQNDAALREHIDRLEDVERDRKGTRLNSSHVKSSYAVFCSKKKTSRGASC